MTGEEGKKQHGVLVAAQFTHSSSSSPPSDVTIDVLLTMEKQQQLLIKTRMEEKNMNELLVTLLVTGCLYSGTLETYHYI